MMRGKPGVWYGILLHSTAPRSAASKDGGTHEQAALERASEATDCPAAPAPNHNGQPKSGVPRASGFERCRTLNGARLPHRRGAK